MSFKRKIKELGLFGLGALPLKKSKSIFCPIITNPYHGGPGRFLLNLETYLKQQDYRIERFFLSRCRSALFLSNSPGDWFQRLCHRKKIKTILRVDGFYIPFVFDNQNYGNRMKRCLELPQMDINQRMQRDLLMSDWIVYQSEFCKKMADQFLYRRTENFSITYNGVNLEHFSPLRNKKNDIPLILVLGHWRDTDLMLCNLNTFKYVTNSVDSNLKIIGSMTTPVRQTIDLWLKKNPKLRHKISLAGPLDYANLPQEIAVCDVSLHLKSGDWCPNAVLETLACGVPVVCHSWGGTKELVRDVGAIVEHEPYVYDNLLSEKAASACERIIGDLISFKQKARKRAEDNFSVALMAESYLNILDTN